MSSKRVAAERQITQILDDSRNAAWFFTVDQEGIVQCRLCNHQCSISDGRVGRCGARMNLEGTLYSLVYGRAVSQQVDPVEKKPLYHFYPGSTTYSVATAGCNFRCPWCQNWALSQLPREKEQIAGEDRPPEQIVEAALASDCRSIAYTYTEPTIFFEYAYDIARLAVAAGLKNVFVTNGYMSQEMLAAFTPLLDAANVDLKAFREKTYQRSIGARLQPVLDNMKTIKASRIWLEVTTLVIPGLNDDPAELRDAAAFIADELGVDTPWHISRFFPAYKFSDRPPTPMSTLYRARDIGLEAGLQFTYIGNSRQEASNGTRCPGCGEWLIRRSGFAILSNRLKNGRCPTCGALIPGIGLGS